MCASVSEIHCNAGRRMDGMQGKHSRNNEKSPVELPAAMLGQQDESGLLRAVLSTGLVTQTPFRIRMEKWTLHSMGGMSSA